MIPRATLAGFAVDTTAIGLGCAGLFRLPTRSERTRVLEAAYESGIRHFDVAPMYGLGSAERELGRFVRSKRDQTVVATKFGIAPTRAARVIAQVQGPARSVLSRAAVLRRRAMTSGAGPASGKLGALLYVGRGYDAAAAKESLERSLRELRSDYVDLLLLHDPAPRDVRDDDLYEYLENARQAGLLRSWGIAGERHETAALADRVADRPCVFQVRDDIFLRSSVGFGDDGQHSVISYGVLGRALPRIREHLAGSEERSRRWNDAVGADCTDPDTLGTLLLRDALHANAQGVVLFTTVHPSRIPRAIEATATDRHRPDPQVEALRRLVEHELKV